MTALPWIVRAPGVPCFMTEHGEARTPIGQNDSVAWPELNGSYRRRNLVGSSDTCAGWPTRRDGAPPDARIRGRMTAQSWAGTLALDLPPFGGDLALASAQGVGRVWNV